MTITSNFGITRLFVSKEIQVTIKDKDEQNFIMRLKSIRETYLDPKWWITYNWLTRKEARIFLKDKENISDLDALKMLLCSLGQYQKFSKLFNDVFYELQEIIPNFKILNIQKQELAIGNIIITEEIWDFVLYILKLSCGEEVKNPTTFGSPEAKRLYLAQKEAEEKIKKIKNSKKESSELMKDLLFIIYAFPSLTLDYLFEQTMAQIQWLQKYAAGSVSYQVNAQAFAAGNVKKGKKLDFFIK